MGYLQHYGILGMKWGVRRTPEQLGHKREVHPDSVRARSKRADEMSDTELRNSINRVRMEKEYNDLTASSFKKGRQQAASVLAGSGAVILKAAVGVAGAALAKKYIGDLIAKGAFEAPIKGLISKAASAGRRGVATAALAAQLRFGG